MRKVLRHGKGAAGGSSFQKLCLQINGNILLGNLMLLCIAGEHQGQSAVAGYVAGGSEAVLKGKDGQHQGGSGIVKFQDAGDDAKRGHNCTAGNAGRADGKNTQEHTEEHHRPKRRNGAVQDLGNGHAEEDFCENGTAEVDVGEQRNAKLHHILAERF